MNARFWKVLGYNPDEMPHKSNAWQNIINQNDLKLASDKFTRHCENPDHPYEQVVRYTHKDGSTVWIRCRGLAIRDKNGKPVRVLGAHQDISDIKRSEQELVVAKEKVEESEAMYRMLSKNLKQERILFRTIIDSIPDAVYLKDLKSWKMLANKADCYNCGFEKEEDIIGKTDLDIFPFEIAEKFLNDDKNVFKEGVSIANKMAHQGAGLGLAITKAYVGMLG